MRLAKQDFAEREVRLACLEGDAQAQLGRIRLVGIEIETEVAKRIGVLQDV
jgi:hypothetical protein